MSLLRSQALFNMASVHLYLESPADDANGPRQPEQSGGRDLASGSPAEQLNGNALVHHSNTTPSDQPMPGAGGGGPHPHPPDAGPPELPKSDQYYAHGVSLLVGRGPWSSPAAGVVWLNTFWQHGHSACACAAEKVRVHLLETCERAVEKAVRRLRKRLVDINVGDIGRLRLAPAQQYVVPAPRVRSVLCIDNPIGGHRLHSAGIVGAYTIDKLNGLIGRLNAQLDGLVCGRGHSHPCSAMPHFIRGQMYTHEQLEDRALIHSILLDRPLHSDYSNDANVQDQGMQAQVCMIYVCAWVLGRQASIGGA
jgi:hypothetical protein